MRKREEIFLTLLLLIAGFGLACQSHNRSQQISAQPRRSNESSEVRMLLSTVEDNCRTRWKNELLLVDPKFNRKNIGNPKQLEEDDRIIDNAEKGTLSAAILREYRDLKITDDEALVEIHTQRNIKGYGLVSGLTEQISLRREASGRWSVTNVRRLSIADY